jgi:hypothetical protein
MTLQTRLVANTPNNRVIVLVGAKMIMLFFIDTSSIFLATFTEHTDTDVISLCFLIFRFPLELFHNSSADLLWFLFKIIFF